MSRRLPSAALTISTRQTIRRLLAANAAASTSTSSAEASSAGLPKPRIAASP